MSTHKSMLLTWAKTTEHVSTPARTSAKRTPMTVIPESGFVEMLRFERRRTERSGRQFMLVLLSSKELRGKAAGPFLGSIVAAVSATTRETDVLGWYEQDATLGLLMTEIGQADAATTETIVKKISDAVRKAISPESFKQLSLIFRIFPQQVENEATKKGHFTVYPDLAKRHAFKRHAHLLKRSMDIVGSVFALVIFSPVIVMVSILIKLTSGRPGPLLPEARRTVRQGVQLSEVPYYVREQRSGHPSRVHGATHRRQRRPG